MCACVHVCSNTCMQYACVSSTFPCMVARKVRYTRAFLYTCAHRVASMHACMHPSSWIYACLLHPASRRGGGGALGPSPIYVPTYNLLSVLWSCRQRIFLMTAVVTAVVTPAVTPVPATAMMVGASQIRGIPTASFRWIFSGVTRRRRVTHACVHRTHARTHGSLADTP